MTTPAQPLAGRRVLVVEDEFIVAAMLADMLEDEGAEVVGPIGTQVDALAVAASEALDVAVLDWNLNGEPGAPVARILRARGIPFAISTGYGAVEAEFADVPVLNKPYAPARLTACLEGLLAG
ncbi:MULTISPECIES: response regulator [unclassified Novosphingobium]|uniref:response regulator n=1 Tax=unclassified Novosphingobium TaxID=2644732 RepID=UPI001448071B|nr:MULTISPECIES: response regulator [unclassified Novosphingobium]NKJ43619.1 DNA-binding response OmpR family regulator [Novosphingobium sp. SG720]NMN06115.1 DNA-binding response OmpR family regulator [Novosphingobium sp. SG919]NMN88412.1 DNA-binding response OmpR family regulator [Novosphingobium sp. SG916]